MAISSKELITPAVMADLKKSVDEAHADTTPYAGVAGNEVSVIGDANKIEMQKHDYKVTVIWEREMAEKYGIKQEDIIKENDTHVAFEMEFKDVRITPMNRFKVTSAIADFLPFFFDPKKDGDVEERSLKELTQLSVEMSEEILDSMYLFVGAVLGVKKDVYENFDFQSVLELTHTFLRDFPDILGETVF